MKIVRKYLIILLKKLIINLCEGSNKNVLLIPGIFSTKIDRIIKGGGRKLWIS